MLADARIRLEGRLEELERATRALELARPQVKQGHWQAAKDALGELVGASLAEARGQALTLARSEPELTGVLRRMDTAGLRLVEAVHRKAKANGVTGSSAAAELDALAAQQVLFERQLRSPWALFMPFFAVCVVGIGAAFAAKGAWPALPFISTFVGLFTWQYVRAPHVLVAKDVVVVNGRATPTAEVERVLFAPGFLKDTHQMTLRLKIGSVGFTLPTLPDALVGALRSVGLEVTHRQWWSE
jgi:hypothetical protein